MLPEEFVKKARRNTGYLCYEAILIDRIEKLKAKVKELEAFIKSIKDTYEEDITISTIKGHKCGHF